VTSFRLRAAPFPLKRIALAALAAAAAFILPACRGRSSTPPKPGEVVYYGETDRIRGLDPCRAGDVASALAASRMYEGLYEYAYLARPYRLQPALAEGMPVISDDGLVYTIRIRRGIYFADDPCFTNSAGKGRELTAGDFIFAIKRNADVKSESTGYWAFNERIEGLDAFREASLKASPTSVNYDIPVAGLQAPDPYTLKITLTRPYPQFVWILAMHYAFAVPREAVEYYDGKGGRGWFHSHPVGTGPYILSQWIRNYRIEFVRNPKWAETGRVERYPGEGAPGDAEKGLLASAGKPVPFIDRIVQYVIGDASTQWLMFLTGQVEQSGVSRDNWDAVIGADRGLTPELAAKGVRLHTAASMTTYYMGFNMEDPVVGPNRKLRQAMCCAFDAEAWSRYYNLRMLPANGPIPPGIAGARTDADANPYAYNLEKAKRLLEEAGYPGGIDPKTGRRLTLSLEQGSANDSDARASVELFASFMERIGIRIEASYNNWPTFLDKLDRRQCQMFRLAWVSDYPDAENFLQLFYGPNSSPGPNHSNYSNPEFDTLYERVRVMPDTPERTALYARMADIAIEDSPWLCLSYPLSFGLQHGWVKNYKPHDFPYGMLKYYDLDPAARDAWRARYQKESAWSGMR
jgi:ABC-type transport system substrate-binding protein